MSVFSGKSETELDAIADSNVSRRMCEDIYYELNPVSIGELKFVSRAARSQPEGLRLADGVWSWTGEADFDGWVFPDGSRFSVGDFPEAAAEYGSSDGSFAVPNLDGKFFSGGSGPMFETPEKCDLPEHSHPMTASAGVQTQITIKNGFVFCAAGNFGGTRKQKYYTHPATIDKNGNKLTGNKVGTMRPVNPSDPNYPPGGVSAEDWSLEYTVPTFHSGNCNYAPSKAGTYLPIPFDMTLKSSDVAAWFENGQTKGVMQDTSYPYAIGSGLFEPESVSIPVMIYIGRKRVEN
jgi:hypothetical protein